MPLTVAELFSSPDHFLHSLEGEDAVFVPMDAAAYRRSIFLDDRIQPARETAMRIPLRTLLAAPFETPAPIGWIFHIAHCGSTLLARALDELGGGIVLREPLALRQAALMRDPAILQLVLRMMGKRYDAAAATVVKANVPVNFVVRDIAAAMPDAAAAFLYYGLEDYVLAILRSANHRAWLGRITGELAPVMGNPALRCDGERVAALWLAQLRMFRSGLVALPNARTLDAETFFADPTQTLAAAAALFGYATKPDRIAAVAHGSLFATYAKNPAVAFENADRIERRNALRPRLEPELAAAHDWLSRNADDLPMVIAALEARSLGAMTARKDAKGVAG